MFATDEKMKLLKFYFLGVLIVIYINHNKGQTLPEGNPDQATACADAVLRMACPSGEVIAVKEVRYGTKLTTTCQQGNTSDACCQYDAGDCFDPLYINTAEIAACSGYNVCNKDKADSNAVRAGQEDSSSCGADYPGLTHYLVMDYYCIQDIRIGKISLATLQETDKLLYIQNTDYPAGPIRAAESNASCSIETTSCSSQINVYFVHFELSDGGGSCTQYLQVDNEDIYTCSDNTNYTINLKLTSISNYIKLTLNNPDGINGGKFWIGFEETDNAAPLMVSCPATEQTSCIDCPGLTPPNGGNLSTTDVTTGTSVDVFCFSGYTLFGEATLDCHTNGTWSAEVGPCQKDCDYPTKVGYNLGTPTANTYNSTVSVNSCDTGYTGNPSLAELTCEENGTWSEVSGCTIVDCNSPTIAGYTLGTSPATTYGSSVTVTSCDAGYTGSPSATELTCNETGTWSEVTGCIIIGLGDGCTLPSDCSAVAYSACKNNVCTCVEGYTQSNNECTSASSGEKEKGLSSEAIAVIVIVAVVFVIICFLVLFYIRKRVQRLQKDENQSVENGATSSKTDDTSLNGAIPTNSEDIASPDTEFRPPQLLSCDLNDIHMPIRACPYRMYRDDTSYASSLSFLTKNNVALDKTSKENKIPNKAVENEGNLLELEARKSNQFAITDAALELRRQVIPNETLIDEETWKGAETLKAEKPILSETILRTEAVVAGNKLKNEQDMIPDKTSKENKLPYEVFGNEENLTNYEVLMSNQIATPERDLEHRQQVINKETLMTKAILNRDDTSETENSQLSDKALQTQGAAYDMLQNEENIISDGILKSADKIILGKTLQNEQNAISDELSKSSGKEISEDTPRYRGIVIPILTPKTEDRLVPVIAPQREQPSKQSPSLKTKSPGTEVLIITQAKGQMPGTLALGETVDQGLSPLDTAFRLPHFTPCDLTDIHMPERVSPNLMYQDDAYQSFADTQFRPPRFTSNSFSDIHIPERASPYHMYRDDSAYDSFEESLTSVETT